MARSVLTIVDVQERLFNAMDAERRDEMVANVKILATAASSSATCGLWHDLPKCRFVGAA